MLTIVRFCAEEVERQGRTAIQVPGMVEAWLDARTVRPFQDKIYEDDILRWASMIEDCNQRGYRSVAVRVGNRLCPNPLVVPNMMKRLFEYQDNMTPEEITKEFLDIHPFLDGNGRVSAILYCYVLDRLDSPTRAPDFWSGQ